jgi:3-methyladenine DNA glycosylase AlkD
VTRQSARITTVDDALAWLEKHGKRSTRDGMARYGIVAPRAYGVSMADIKSLGKRVGRNHALAGGLWKSGWYEARTLVAFVAEPERLTVAEMDRWCKDFDNWAICDSLCFHLFDRSKHALGRIDAWAPRKREFVRRAAFALLASVALHRHADDDALRERLPLAIAAADDDRNFVKKAVSWALRTIGGRRAALHEEVRELARGLSEREGTAKWIGRDVLRDIERPAVRKRLGR